MLKNKQDIQECSHLHHNYPIALLHLHKTRATMFPYVHVSAAVKLGQDQKEGKYIYKRFCEHEHKE